MYMYIYMYCICIHNGIIARYVNTHIHFKSYLLVTKNLISSSSFKMSHSSPVLKMFRGGVKKQNNSHINNVIVLFPNSAPKAF